jgi:hypothetical protein
MDLRQSFRHKTHLPNMCYKKLRLDLGKVPPKEPFRSFHKRMHGLMDTARNSAEHEELVG